MTKTGDCHIAGSALAGGKVNILWKGNILTVTPCFQPMPVIITVSDVLKPALEFFTIARPKPVFATCIKFSIIDTVSVDRNVFNILQKFSILYVTTEINLLNQLIKKTRVPGWLPGKMHIASNEEHGICKTVEV